MSTRSAIIMRLKNGSYAGIYCHFDGYCAGGVGRTLLDHYQDPEKVRALIELGDISTLGERVDPIGPHGFGCGEGLPREDGTTCAYMRDRGEKDCEAKVGKTLKSVVDKIGHNGYVYVFAGGLWTCNGMGLAEAVKIEEREVEDQRLGRRKYCYETIPDLLGKAA
jgi:hypothetical protein